MAIFRGDGGAGDSNTDATITIVTQQATIATTKASEAAASAAAANTSESAAASSATAAATSATSSASSATSSATSATSSSTSATASAASATAAATAETNAETAETNAETAETNAAASAATATTKAGEAATSATNASTSASTATTKASEASTSASNASTSETNAATSSSTATTKASEASTSASNAATSATNAAASYDDFDDRYLGAKSSAPTTDNDGDALVTGALYFNTTTDSMKVWSGSAWLDAYASLSGALIATNNLSDLNNAATSRTNLGLGTAATTASTDYATAAQADQTVVLTGAGTTTVSGTYPNFTITGAGTTYTAGSGLSLTGTEFANTAPDQTVSLTGAGTTTVTGTYPNFTITGAGTTYTAGTGLTLTGTEFSIGQGVATTDSPAFAGLTVDTDTLAVDSTNNRVGIGTSSPSAKLTVSGTGVGAAIDWTNTTASTGRSYRWVSLNNGTGFAIEDLTAGSERMRIDSSGKVGIGTSSPSKTLVVNENDSECVAIIKSSDTGTAGLFLGGQTDEIKSGIVFNNSDNSLQLRGYNNAERMRIDSSGNVGIGTSSPATALDVNGGITCDDLQVDLPNATATAQITTPTNLSGFQSFKIINTHTSGTLSLGTALGASRIQAFGYMGTTMPLKIDLGNVTALDFETTGITTLGMSGQSQLVLDKRGTQNTFKYISATAFTSGLQTAHFYGTTMLSSSISANTIYGVALPGSSTSGRFYPAQSGVNGLFRDNSIDCGHPSARWDDVYATNGTIQTSDEREKQDIEELTDVEQRVAVRAKGLLRKFRWKDSVEDKGDDARTHFGIIAQDLEAAFVAEGLDPRDYAMFIKTEWWIGPKTWPSIPEELDEEGNVISEGEDSHVEEEHYYEDEADAPSDATHHYRMGVRYSELLAFIIAAL